MIDLPQPTGSELWPPEEPVVFTPLNRPVRAFVALAEVVLAAALVWLAFVFWGNSHVTLVNISADGAKLESVRYFGGWLAAAIGLGIVAGLLLIDAVRELLLAVRTHHRNPRDNPQASHSEPLGN